ncbi:type II toxin-antitoxin system VapC family toxin [Mucilaginibacter mali]|uniref:Type II toxin-antitoxin system VapC family toxin n=1 Tax=Mucilaginibacter mali TaxID=2740462 RepID=A0A7D4UJW6_9SPHI|nr:PIN domain-containing protein [Mucilaginibacter mali]QKJ29682.1 type II toxin-antitoxin system VapC family toxin [Mucilaginibacter mali]
MVFNIFLDANVLLDYLLIRSNYQNAKAVFNLVVSGRVKAFITPSIVHLVGHWLTKSYGSAKAKEMLLIVLADVTVIDIDHEITLLALHSKIDDIEDALQYYSALRHQLDIVISEDKDFQKEGTPSLPVVSAKYFFENIYK